MISRPRDSLGGESRAVDADHVAQVIPPAHLPQRRVYAALAGVVLPGRASDEAERARQASGGQAERSAHAQRVRRDVECRWIGRDFDLEALVVTEAVASIAGTAIGR